MATVYSLICWGGYTGKSVTGSDSGDYLLLTTSAAHGVSTGMGLAAQFTATTLPGNISASTTYYLGYGTSTTTMYVYDTEANAIAGGTTGRVAYSSAGTSVVAKSAMVADPSTALAPYGLSDLSRWDAGGGSYRIYDGIAAYITANTGSYSLDVHVCEIGEGFIETYDAVAGTGLTILSFSAYTVRIQSRVNGVLSTASAQGIVNISNPRGYVLSVNNIAAYAYCISISKYRSLLEGITIKQNTATTVSALVSVSKAGSGVKGCTLIGYSATNPTACLNVQGQISTVERNLCIYGAAGMLFINNVYGVTVSNNTIVRANEGVKTYTQPRGFFFNNISLGNNTSDWVTTGAAYLEGGFNNCGKTGTIFDTSGTSIAITSSSPFTDVFADYNNHDYRLVSPGPVIDVGLEYYDYSKTDIQGLDVPSYNNGGSEAVDIGAYEYDNGYGPHPASTTVTFSGVPAGSEIRVYDSGGVELAGIESSAANQVLTWDVASGAQRIVIINLAYKIKEFSYINQAGVQTVPVQMDADPWYENP